MKLPMVVAILSLVCACDRDGPLVIDPATFVDHALPVGTLSGPDWTVVDLAGGVAGGLIYLEEQEGVNASVVSLSWDLELHTLDERVGVIEGFQRQGEAQPALVCGHGAETASVESPDFEGLITTWHVGRRQFVLWTWSNRGSVETLHNDVTERLGCTELSEDQRNQLPFASVELPDSFLEVDRASMLIYENSQGDRIRLSASGLLGPTNDAVRVLQDLRTSPPPGAGELVDLPSGHGHPVLQATGSDAQGVWVFLIWAIDCPTEGIVYTGEYMTSSTDVAEGLAVLTSMTCPLANAPAAASRTASPQPDPAPAPP